MIRSLQPGDRAFVAHSWLKSFESSHWAGGLSRDEYWRAFTPVVDAILDAATVLVECNPEDHEHIFGWVCYRPNAVLHYVYVKALFRDTRGDASDQPRLARGLLMATGLGTRADYTFRTPAWDRYRATHRLGGDYEPRLREDA